MSYYAIGFGGTGAKCIESLIHLCAAGFMPDDRELYVLFVDQDGDNGSLERAQLALSSYRSCQTDIIRQTDFIKTKISASANDNWMPAEDRTATLDKFVGYSDMTNDYKRLIEVLYDKKERETPMGMGFRGHPSIGATVFAAAVNLDSVDPWKTILSEIEKDPDARVMFFGSIFGGTGAAGVPTISRLFRNWRERFDSDGNFKLGSILALPYFTFQKNEGNELHADSRDFLVNTQSALHYYQQQAYLEVFDKSYLVGWDDPRDLGKAEIGSRNQNNPPHWVELYSALAAIDFFGAEKFDGNRYNLIGRESKEMLRWSDLPFDVVESRRKLMTLTRFAFAFRSVYFPAIDRIYRGANAYVAPWYIEYFQRPNVNLQDRIDNELGPIAAYCDEFLRWIAGIEYSISGSTGTNNLVNCGLFADLAVNEDGKLEIGLRQSFLRDRFSDLALGEERSRRSLPEIWEQMCERYSTGTDETSTRHFIECLFSECGK